MKSCVINGFLFQGKPGFLRELGPSLPTKTPEEIQQHESWYREYLMLNDRKKEAIAEWKIRKQVDINPSNIVSGMS